MDEKILLAAAVIGFLLYTRKPAQPAASTTPIGIVSKPASSASLSSTIETVANDAKAIAGDITDWFNSSSDSSSGDA